MSNDKRISAALPAYVLGQVIGHGRCGQLWLASEETPQRTVAIRLIPAQFADDPVARRRFKDKAKLLADLSQPHVASVYDLVEDGDLCLLVMEYLPGGSVASRFTDDGLSAAAAVAIVLAAAAGLEAAHRQGILHRDVRPANMLFAEDGTVKLADFDIIDGDGSPLYSAPEHARGEQVSPETDVYALATTLYELLSGVLPFPSGGGTSAIVSRRKFEDPIALTAVAPGVPGSIADVVMRGLAREPADRFGSAEDFGVALAASAKESWGPHWLTVSGIAVNGSDPIVEAATKSNSGEAKQHSTVLPESATTKTKPTQTAPPHRVETADSAAPFSAIAAFGIAGVLALAALVLGLVGIGGPEHGGDLLPGTVRVAGQDPVTTRDIAVDATVPIPITMTGRPGEQVTLALNILGRSVGRRATEPLPAGQRSVATALTVNPWLLAGRTTAEVTVIKGQSTIAIHRFRMSATQPASRTAAAAVAVVAAFLAVAAMESQLRALAKGAAPAGGAIAVSVSGAVLGVAVVGLAWILLGQEPSVPGLIGCAALTTAAAVVARLGALKVGRRVRKG